MSWSLELVSTSDRFLLCSFLVRDHLFPLYFTLFLLLCLLPLLESVRSKEVRNDFKIFHQLSNFTKRDLARTSKWHKLGKNDVRTELVTINMFWDSCEIQRFGIYQFMNNATDGGC